MWRWFKRFSPRHRVNQELLRTEQRLTFLLNRLPGVILYETGGGREYISPTIEKVLGFSTSSFTADRSFFGQLIHPEDNERMAGELAEWTQGGRKSVFQTELRVRNASGAYVWFEDHMVSVEHPDGSRSMMGLMFEISERKRSELALLEAKNQAEELNRIKSDILANFSHELRTPLHAILGFGDLLKEELGESPLRVYAESIQRSGQRLLNTLGSVLELAALKVSDADVCLYPIRLADILEEFRALYEPRAREQHLEFRLDLQDPEIVSLVDPERLKKVLHRVLSNAFKFTERGSINITLRSRIIRTRTGHELERAMIEIRDTGIGMSRKFLPIAFEEFTQESSGWNRSFEGTGLGLSIAYAQVQLMKGEIVLESERLKGTTVRITFPKVRLQMLASRF